MKLLGYFLIIATVYFSAKKMIDYFRYVKVHQKQVAQIDELIIELRAKQKTLNERAKIIRNSEEFQRNRLNTIYLNVFEIADKYFTCH